MLRLLIVFTVLLLLPNKSFAERGGDLGVGFIIGSPSSLNVKYFDSSKVAYDAGLAFDSHDYIMLYADYLLHFPGMFKSESSFINSLNPYVGVGPFVAFSDHGDHTHGPGNSHDHDMFGDGHDDFALGLRVPLGVEWRATEIPLGVALEIAPGISILPDTDSLIGLGLALRYYF